MEEKWYNLSQLSIQEPRSTAYYVVIKATILSHLKGKCAANIGKVIPGMLVEVIGNESNEALRVKLYSTSQDEIWHQTEWRCHPIDLLSVSPLIWRLLCSVSSLQERIRLATNKQFCKNVEDIGPNSKVWYCQDSQNPVSYLANVKFVGPVPELGDGYYFGLDLLDNPDICKSSPLSNTYFRTYNSPGTFATISNIEPKKTAALEAIKNFEKNFLSNDILQPKKTDNFFIKNKGTSDNADNKRNAVSSKKDKYSLLADNDNNNQATGSQQATTFNVGKGLPHEEVNENKKLYRNLKSFDPLNSDDEMDEVDKHAKNIQHPINTGDLSVGSCVKVLVDKDTHYGIIRGIGSHTNSNSKKLMAAIELDGIHPLATDGTHENKRYFQCNQQKAWFTNLKDCHQYDMAASSCYYNPKALHDSKLLESLNTNQAVPPISVKGDLEEICGQYRGIQGHHNSCYLDATLFSMFAFTCVFDSLLFRPPYEKDCPQYEEVQRVLREEIVNPLRKELFVKADRVMKLRTLLEKLSSVSGLTSEEKDPEEFLTSLVAQTLNAEPFLKLSSGQDAYHYQLFVEKDDKLILPTVQQLLEQSFLTSNIRLKEVPACLILQMPRFGKSYKMYSKIQPTLLLDVTDIIQDSPRQCTVCGKLAKFECKECYGQCGEGLESIAFCQECLEKVHCHERRTNHEPKTLTVPIEYDILKEHCSVPRLYLELLAVVCIETSHYVSFVKCAPGSEAPWCFFDSMADRKGEQDGYNIPEMVPCPDFPYWLSEEGASYLSTLKDDRSLPEHAKRLLCDAYMCMYQSPDVMMYQ
ncbi:ubiquitin carboxyl-terminal hydrolase CYLD isoform X1 [Nasonia vitripennis]|uniref:ubiquitinyl hydrolase 1 n=1 Tax=Nasonia vitripennis TaxID=7425 RepID=A0A7M7PUG7_NASVI|nr:ubiquitin carboxyl-terminal hydrolase CYLD isoform X1 [Nasonia vitripennis]